MTPTNTDPYGSKETNTEYEHPRRSGSRSGFAGSVWAFAVALILLAFLVGWLLYHPVGPEAAPGSSAGSGIVTTPAPRDVSP